MYGIFIKAKVNVNLKPRTRINVHLAKLYTRKWQKNVLWQYIYAGVWAKLYSYLGLTNLKLHLLSTRRMRLELAELKLLENCDHLNESK